MKRVDKLHQVAGEIQLLRVLVRITGDSISITDIDLLYALKRYYPKANILNKAITANGVKLQVQGIVSKEYFEGRLMDKFVLLRGLNKLTEIEYQEVLKC